ncbi:unnamed protein product [marine sediment metagenome]|uniref:Uncharacterized protein n=1 Tax=marine sediment metagenome TaxID=412755 RepID=X1HPV5_9ZZZZ
MGLKSDGTVVAVGDNASGQYNIGGWTNITRVATGTYHTVGLKSDGTMVAVGLETEFAEWNLFVADFEGISSVNWQLIGSVIAVVIVGLTIFFVRRKRVT